MVKFMHVPNACSLYKHIHSYALNITGNKNIPKYQHTKQQQQKIAGNYFHCKMIDRIRPLFSFSSHNILNNSIQ